MWWLTLSVADPLACCCSSFTFSSHSGALLPSQPAPLFPTVEALAPVAVAVTAAATPVVDYTDMAVH